MRTRRAWPVAGVREAPFTVSAMGGAERGGRLGAPAGPRVARLWPRSGDWGTKKKTVQRNRPDRKPATGTALSSALRGGQVGGCTRGLNIILYPGYNVVLLDN